MIHLLNLLTPVDGSIIGRDDTNLYAEPDIRAKATRVVELKKDGRLAVLATDELRVSFVVFRFAAGTSDGSHPTLYERVFDGEGPSGELRELRHTDWGEDGYLFYAPGALIADAFEKLKEWFNV